MPNLLVCEKVIIVKIKIAFQALSKGDNFRTFPFGMGKNRLDFTIAKLAFSLCNK